MKTYVKTVCKCGNEIEGLKRVPIMRLTCRSCGQQYDFNFACPRTPLTWEYERE